jgi:hypothetical protein
MKHSKMLALAVCAMLALTAFAGASSASAAKFKSSVASVALTGTQVGSHVFTVTGSEVTCTTANFTGTGPASKESETQKMHPEYSGCKAFGIINATINTAGCNYLFNANTTAVNLVDCTAGKITVTANSFLGNCGVEVPNQNGISEVTTATMGSTPSRTITANANATNIKDTVTTSTGICPLTKASHTNSVYTGLTEVKAASGEVWKE